MMYFLAADMDEFAGLCRKHGWYIVSHQRFSEAMEIGMCLMEGGKHAGWYSLGRSKETNAMMRDVLNFTFESGKRPDFYPYETIFKGEVLIDGHNMKDIDLRSYRKYLAVVPQTSILFSGTIRDNITYGVDNVDEATLDEIVKAANLTDLINSLPDGLDTMVGEHGGKLSGGQRQRISIARALIRNPKVIVLDEATSALDSISEKLIQEALNNLTKDRTTFIVAHRLSTIKDADKIAVIADGHCVEYGTYDELMNLKGEFYQMKKIQS